MKLSNKSKQLALIFFIFFGIIAFGFHLSNLGTKQEVNGQDEESEQVLKTEPIDEANESTPEESVKSEYTIEEVRVHNTPEDCLVAYEKSVYEIPYEWATTHPGGFEAFLQACGNDITEMMKIHQTDSPFEILNDFKIGELKI